MSKYDIKERCLDFAVEIIKLASLLPKTPAGYAIANQLIKAGTSIGANVVEAQDSISKKEFIKTINIALKESRETLYWLVIIQRTELITSEKVRILINEGKEIRAILSTIVRNSKSNP